MAPEEYIEQLIQFAREGEAARLLEFALEHGPALQESMTSEQWQKESDLGHWAIRLADLKEAARQRA